MKHIKVLLALVFLMSASQVWASPLVDWSIAGPGTTSATENAPGDWDLTYLLNPAGFSEQSWTVQATAGSSGDYEFDWNYAGFHAFFNVTAFLVSSQSVTLYDAGPANCCSAPSSGFNVSGNYTFTGLTAGDVFGFTMGGGNGDSNNQLGATLNLVQVAPVPEPSAMILLLLGVLLVGFSQRKPALSVAA